MIKDREKIKEFVQHTLGCTCPEEVFNRIDVEDASGPDTLYDQRITVGGKLLIYIKEVDGVEQLAGQLPLMLADGIKRRDSEGLNRFRAVLVTDNVLAITDIATRIFDDYPDKEEKIHLHVIDRKSI